MNSETTKQQGNEAPDVMEDLTINQDQAAEVKGGAQVDYFLRLQTVDGDITSNRKEITELTSGQ